MALDGASDWKSIIGIVVCAKIKRIENETMSAHSLFFLFLAIK
ncbi:hypothetical protein SPFL3102_00707 [Sporomusaceae bacterium FL31]|nr:hypothetical protein SPFL3101_00549 [Sporomusaceae bacterium FL31]GCE32906.1 hypothetical protein SPFL3102_00707 [Sporomusaceae bacterium]